MADLEIAYNYGNEIYQQFGVTLQVGSKCAFASCKQRISMYEPVIDMECTNNGCKEAKMMHPECFDKYETKLVDELAKQARYKHTKHRDIQSRLWKDDCYQLVYKHCTCSCTSGCLLKKMSKSRRRQQSTSSVGDHDSGVSCSPKQSPDYISPEVRLGNEAVSEIGTMREFIKSEISVIMKNLKVKKRGKKNIASIGTVITDTYTESKPSDITAEELKLRPMKQTNFKHRSNYQTLKFILPPEKFNSTHIAVESSGFGCDELRNYILSNLAMCDAESLDCLICKDSLPVFDAFPLINGLMFQSPDSYIDQLTPSDYEPPHLKINGENMYIHAVCVACAQQDDIVFECKYCSTPWDGSPFQIGNLIKYDVFAGKPCCSQRVTCKNCKQPLGDVKQPRSFSYFSRLESCYQCGYTDYHCVKPLSTYRLRISSSSELNNMMLSTPPLSSCNQEYSPKLTSPAYQIQMQQKHEVEKKKEKTKKSFGSCAMDEVVILSRKT